MKDFKTKNGFFTGNVGIGTTSPGKTLHIAANAHHIALEDTNGTAGSKMVGIYNNNQQLHLGRYSDDNFNDFTTDLFINSTGNVGIGTTNPDFNLSVVSDTDPAKIGIHGYGSFSDGTVAAQLLFLGKDSNGNNRDLAHIQVREHSNTLGTGSMEFSTRIGGNEAARMTISDVGNVGIGTTNPGEMLVIQNSSNPTLQIRDGDQGSASPRTAGTLHLGETAALGVAIENYTHGFNDVCSMIFKTTAAAGSMTERMRISTDGKVGIGTTNPAVQLNIKNQSTTSNKVQIGFTSQDGTQNAVITHTDEAGEERLALGCGGFNFEHFVLDNSGNVGIGTTNPQNKLTVQSDSISNTLTEAVSIIGGNYTNPTNAESFKFFHQTQASNTNRGVAFKSIDGSLTIQTIVTSNNSSFANNILLQPNTGNVGIGTTNPATTLNVLANHGVGDGVAFFKNESTDFGMGVKIQAGGSQDTQRYALRVDDAAGNSLLFCQSKTGNVGIGTTNPNQRLHTENNINNSMVALFKHAGTSPYGIQIQHNTDINNTTNWFFECLGGSTSKLKVWSNGSVQNATNVYGQLSDIKLKENVADATPKLDDLNKVRVVNFNFKGDDLKQIGVVAQELEEIFPGLVDDVPDHDEDGNLLETTTKSVKYSVFGPILIKAIQEQQTIIEDLKARIETLES